MHTKGHTFVALFDATPEHAHFESPILAATARMLGKELREAHLGVIARIASGVVGAVLGSLEDTTGSVALSPASNKGEHVQAFRLPLPNMPLIYTGRGALGADMMALKSASAVLVVGSYPKVLEAIIDSAKDTMVPIGILSDEEPSSIHERIRARDPRMTASLFISHEPHRMRRLLCLGSCYAVSVLKTRAMVSGLCSAR